MAHLYDCPHCGIPIQIVPSEYNCKIFRHGVYKDSLKQIDPHSPKDVCDQLVMYDLIYGCGKPFQLIKENGVVKLIVCDYI